MPRMTKKYLEFRKKEIEARFNDPDFKYHNTMDRERERKSNGYYEDTRKRIDECVICNRYSRSDTSGEEKIVEES